MAKRSPSNVHTRAKFRMLPPVRLGNCYFPTFLQRQNRPHEESQITSATFSAAHAKVVPSIKNKPRQPMDFGRAGQPVRG